jgi:ABC-type polysaccharide transport system permease subunit
MSLVFFFLKLYPFFGASLTFLCFDLAQSFKRKGNKAWSGMAAFAVLFAATTILWIVFRGDRNADLWFARLSAWLRG